MPNFVKNKFGDDLVVGEGIPEKNKVNIESTVNMLKKTGFINLQIGYGHLFFFVFGWLDRFIPLSRIPAMTSVYNVLITFEQYLLKYKYFQGKTEVFYIKCTKK